MRASATAKIDPPAHLHAAQAKPHARKTDEASPFALLMDSAQPKEGAARKDVPESAEKPADSKAAAKQNARHAAKQDARQDKQDIRQDDKAEAAETKAQTAATDRQTDKADKADKAEASDESDKRKDAVETAARDAAPIPVADLQQAETPIPQAAPAQDQTSDVESDAVLTAQAAVTQDAQDAAAQAQAQAAVQPPAKAEPKPAASKDDIKAVKAAAQGETVSGTAKSGISTAAADTPKSDFDPADAAQAQADKAGEGKTNPLPPETAAPADKPAPVQAASLSTIAAPQALQHAAPIRHVEVTAQPKPDLPALAVTIAAKSQSGARQFDIRLDPPELGRVDVRLSIDAAGKTSAHLSADQPQTLDLLQKDASSLTRALRDAGLDVSQDGLNFSLRQQAHNHDGNSAGHNGRARTLSLTATASIDPIATSTALRGLADGRLDIRV